MGLTTLSVRFAAACLVLGLTACVQAEPSTGPDRPEVPSASAEAAPAAESASALPLSPSPTVAAPAYRRPKEVMALWESYPWAPNDGLACPSPADSPGTSLDPAAPGVVIVMGDSLIRDARSAITAEFADIGYDVVFVCWGGKNLQWGLGQVEQLRSLDLLPACLVVNLGTNDLKGTTAQGLADAVPLQTVAERLTSILSAVDAVPDVFVVDLAADLTAAPGTMSEVGQAPDVWQAAVQTTGVGAAVPWAAAAASGGLIGPDGIHDTAEGQQVRASLIASYVARDCA